MSNLVLQREDLDRDHFVPEFSFPDGSEPSPGFDLEKLDVPLKRVAVQGGVVVADESPRLVNIGASLLTKKSMFLVIYA